MMTRVYRVRCYPTKSQIKKIENNLNICRFVWNKYLEYIIKQYELGRPYPNKYEFSKHFNLLKNTEDELSFVKDCCSKAISYTIDTLHKAMIKFFNKQSKFPKFKSKKRNSIRSLFLRNDGRGYLNFLEKPEYIKLPIYGRMRIKYRKRDMIKRPLNEDIISGRLIKENNKYYICLIYNKEPVNIPKYDISLGIDMGIEKYATLYYSNGIYYSHESILKDKRYKRIEDRIKTLQRVISHKQEINYQRLLKDYKERHNNEEPKEKYKNIMKGVSFNTSNIRQLWNRIRRLYSKRTNIVRDFINKLVNDILVRTKPSSITIETLSIRDMLENDSSSTLHDHIAKSNWYRFFQCLKNKCEEYCIQLRKANKYFASSKKCSNCGNKNINLTLSNRVYICDECGLNIDRDLNAAINLCKLNKYTIVI